MTLAARVYKGFGSRGFVDATLDFVGNLEVTWQSIRDGDLSMFIINVIFVISFSISRDTDLALLHSTDVVHNDTNNHTVDGTFLAHDSLRYPILSSSTERVTSRTCYHRKCPPAYA